MRSSNPVSRDFKDTLGDFTADGRLLVLAAMASLIGIVGSGAAWVLLKLIALITNIAYFQSLSLTLPSFPKTLPLWTIPIPVVGSLLVGLMARFGSEKIRGHGIPEAIEAILIGQSRIQPKVALLKPLSSAISIGTGGPFGAEGPIIMTAGALGSLFAQFFNLSAAERKTLLVAGAAAGMTAVFGTPIAAVLLAVELLLFEWKPRSFVPVATAAMMAIACRPFLIDASPLFPYTAIPQLPWWGLALCAGAGAIAGLQSSLLTISLYGTEDLFRKLPIHWMWWPALGGIIVGVGGYLDPAALGVGYDQIRHLLSGDIPTSDTAVLLITKMIIWIVALSSGTSGGVLAPLLIMGGALGSLEAPFLPFGDSGFWALLGMSAILGGTMRAPLTATFFATELTGNTHLLPPLLAATVTAFAVTVLLMKRSILTERIARRGLHLIREYEIDPFQKARVSEIMTAPVETLNANTAIDDILARFARSDRPPRHKSYPVVDDAGVVLRMLSRADVLKWVHEGWVAGTRLKDTRNDQPLLVGYSDELVGALTDRMAARGIGRVPIIDRQSKQLVGLVARRDILRVRSRFVETETHRSRHLGFFVKSAVREINDAAS